MCSQRQSSGREPAANRLRSTPVMITSTKTSEDMVPRPMNSVLRAARKGIMLSAIPARFAMISSMMWFPSADIPIREVVRCAVCDRIRAWGDSTIRSAASRPAATAALSPMSANTPE